MRAALQCVLIALITTQIQDNKADVDEDFRPTPIPLDYWNARSGRIGTSDQINKTDASPTVAEVPAHYWEDALRHSVYLTLVRDKIDQLIASGAIVSPDNKPDYASKEVDDHDLWEKIKMAPFDRLANEDQIVFGDMTVMARGRLMNENNGFRFAEDKASKKKCTNERCMEGVKALWSVKRMRQRDPGAPPGKYHYELTFSVTSQTPRTQRKPYENPVRTFTVRENPTEEPQRVYDISHKQRPQRAIWFHKNIVPTKHQHSQYNQGLDRIFSSFFSDEESYVETPRHKQHNPYVPQTYPQHSNTGYMNAQVLTPESHYQKRLMPFNYKPQPQSYKYPHPPLSAPPLSNIQPYVDFDSMSKSPHLPPPPPQDHIRYQSSNMIKTTRPAVLPTPVMPITAVSFQNIKNSSMDDIDLILNVTNTTPRQPEIITGFKGSSNSKPAPMKVSYFPDHVRPPVYNAPPGVFVTMDKKPFKPMPPLKLVHSSKPMRTKPIDFRPSPQILDVQYSNPNHLSDSAFKPITVDYANNNNTEKRIPENNKKRKPSGQNNKPLKNLENKMPFTTTVPDIITLNGESEEELESMEWANLLGAFTKTTPMVSQKEIINKTVTPPVTTTAASTTIAMKPKIVEITTTSTSTTTVKPKKRTRPPPKFTKSEMINKHKRTTTTTTTSTTTTTTTKPPEKTTKPIQDLTPQASSAATSRPSWKPKNKFISTTPMTNSSSTIKTTAKPSSTTTAAIRLTTAATQSTTAPTQSTTTAGSTVSSITNYLEPATTQPKIKNRYRQSTLMQKGTSVKHDRWSVSGVVKNKTSVTSKYPPRRKGSNFQGYVFPKLKTTEPEITKEENRDNIANDKLTQYLNNTTKVNELQNTTTQTAETSQTPSTERFVPSSTISTDLSKNEESEEEYNEDNDESTEENDEQEIKDHTEYIFNVTTTPILAEKIIEGDEDKLTTTEPVITTSPHSAPKSKTKCKKKKQQNLTTTQSTKLESSIEHEPTKSTTTDNQSTTDSFIDFFEEFILNDKPKKPDDKSINVSTSIPEVYEEEESESHNIYVHPKDEFQQFMDSLENDDDDNDDNDDEEYDNDDNDYSPFNNVEENSEARNTESDYADYQDRSYGSYEYIPMK